MEGDTKKLEGLGGWLILVGIKTVVTPFTMLKQINLTYEEINDADGAWEILTTPGTEYYHPLWSPLLIGEIGINIVLAILSFYLIFLFFTKNKNFPKLLIGILICSVLLQLIDGFAGKILMPNQPFFIDQEGLREFGTLVMSCLIWIPYMLVSNRVKATFIR